MAAVLLVLIIKIGVWWLMEDDVIEPLGAYHSIFCRPRQLIGHMTIRKALYIIKFTSLTAYSQVMLHSLGEIQ